MAEAVTPSSGDSAAASMPRGLVVVLAVTGLVVTTLALKQFSAILAPVLLALVLVISVNPLTTRLTGRGVPRWLATIVTLVVLFAVILGLALSFVLTIAQLTSVLPTYQHRFAALVDDVRDSLASIGVGPDQLRAAIDEISFGHVAGLVTDLVLGLANTLTSLVFLLFVVVFMTLDAGTFTRRLSQVGARRHPVVTALSGFVRGTRKFLLVSTVFGVITAVLDTAFLLIVDVPLALLWGLLAFITNYIPNIGFVIGLVPPALLALLDGGPRLMLVVIVVYIAINFVVQAMIQPRYVGNAVNLSLTLTFLSLVFWSFVIGPVGAVLAIPLTLLAKALLLDVDPDTRWISLLLSSGRSGDRPGDRPDTAESAHPAESGSEAEPPDEEQR